ncbi:E3 ubiquitin-protein ligase RNF123 [Chionoecetes opilio]|uniref:RING-type E3 ubiquitin transferase n=1 Tax=Chionoecetes opilio TaxID=41210 RepID=A0A8J4YKE7_CHIOP|nr:E3 ubiquitin-protein ligase RNF123 [Chionoecetes opilio]
MDACRLHSSVQYHPLDPPANRNHEWDGASLDVFSRPSVHPDPVRTGLNQGGTQSLLTDVGEFLALHFCDARIVYADSKDSLIQALAGFVCHQPTLAALEAMPQHSRRQMVRNLLQPYENRAWAQNNWILVRFWKGCGFGFRYTKSPHLTNKFGPKPPNSDNSNFTQATAPCPSPTFQRHVVEVLEGSAEVSTPFLNSLLNQLNWAFSEFIGMLQEIQNASNRPERVFIDSRQLRICATCFDLALALLRVLEMVVTVAPQLFTDFARPNAEFLLSRLCQLLCQVLNRVSGWSGCFGHVVSLEIPGLETIHHYPILTAVTGILLTLITHDLVTPPVGDQEPAATGEGGTGGGASSEQAPPNPPASPPRSGPAATAVGGADPEHINACELGQVVSVIDHLEACVRLRGEKSPGEDDDSLCTICYAYPATAVFRPCAHTSCRACVTQHLMNRSDCFFCKATIQEVVDQTSGTTVYQAQTLNSDTPTTTT